MTIDVQHIKPNLLGRYEKGIGARDNYDTYVDFNIVKALGLDVDEVKASGYGRSRIILDALKERLMKFETKQLVFDHECLAIAVSRAMNAFRLRTPVERISLREVTFHKETAAGFGYTGKKGSEGNYERALRIADATLSAGKVCKTPCVAYARGHFGTPEKPKTRLVFGFPFEQTLIEGMYSQPLQEAYLRATSHPMVFGHTSSYVATKMNEALAKGFVQMTDFSSFDSSIQNFLIRLAFDVLLSNFKEVKPKHRKLIEDYFLYTTIQFSDGERYLKKSGVPSGSNFTQLVDSVVSFIVAHYALARQGLNPDLVLVLGDDSLISTKVKVDVNKYVKAASELGIVCSEEKSLWNSTKDVHFLGHWLGNNGCLTRPFIESLDRLIFLERRKTYTAEESIARCMGHYVDSGDARALALAFEIYSRALRRGVEAVRSAALYKVGATGHSTAISGENMFTFDPALLIDH